MSEDSDPEPDAKVEEAPQADPNDWRGALRNGAGDLLMLCLLLQLWPTTGLIDPVRGNLWLLLNLALVFALFPVAVALHELGHAAVAWLLGMGVFRVRVGVGPMLYTRRFGLTRLEVRALGTRGHTTFSPPSGELLTPRLAGVALGGPLANALVLLGLFGLVGTRAFSERFWRGLFVGVQPLHALALAHLDILVSAIIPHTYRSGQRSDAALVGHYLRGVEPQERQQLIKGFYIQAAIAHTELDDLPAGLADLDEGLRRYPACVLLQIARGLHLFELGRVEEGAAVVRSFELDGVEEVYRRMLTYGLCLAAVLAPASDHAEELDGWSETILAASPNDAGALALRGFARLRCGDVDEGERLLAEAESSRAAISGRRGRADVASWIALGRLERGEVEAARGLLEEVRSDPTCPLAPHVERRVAAADG